MDCRSAPGKNSGDAALTLELCYSSAHNGPTTRLTTLASPLQCVHQGPGRSEPKIPNYPYTHLVCWELPRNTPSMLGSCRFCTILQLYPNSFSVSFQLTYSNWGQNEPRSSHASLDCVRLTDTDGKPWATADCTNPNHYICERPHGELVTYIKPRRVQAPLAVSELGLNCTDASKSRDTVL